MEQAERSLVLDTDGTEKVVLRVIPATAATPGRVQIRVKTPPPKLEGGLLATYKALLEGLGEFVGPVAELTPGQARELAAGLIQFADSPLLKP
jgi:hypothetical protein